MNNDNETDILLRQFAEFTVTATDNILALKDRVAVLEKYLHASLMRIEELENDNEKFKKEFKQLSLFN